MKDLTYFVADEVFARFPEYVRGVVIAYGVKNGESPSPLVEMLREAESSVRAQLTLDTLTAHPRIAPWREAFRVLGMKPSEFRASIEALVRRVLRNQELPTINMLVDIGNIVSLHHLVPTGGHAIDEVTQDMALRPATGTEEFVPFGSDQVEHPNPGEIIFAEGGVVLTRRWTWRQANHTLTLPTTTAIEFNVDALPPVSRSEVEAICQEVIGLTRQFCGGRLRYQLLTRQNQRIKLKDV
jgi:DNA/RNA-binding domain of Phe-tRNA-synthetase-like protein